MKQLRAFFRCHAYDYADLTIDVIVDDSEVVVENIPFCGWWGKYGSTEFIPFVLMKGQRVDFGSEEDTDQDERFGRFELRGNVLRSGKEYAFYNTSDDHYALYLERMTNLAEPT